MKIKWLGHASFLITSSAGVRIITDPYAPGGDLNYGSIGEPADISDEKTGPEEHRAIDA